MTELNKNGAINYKVIKGSVDYYDHFESWEGWLCNICGDSLPNDERDLYRHMKNRHQIIVENWGR